MLNKTILVAAMVAFAMPAWSAPQEKQAAGAHKLLVLSIDGLDWRYLRDRDPLGLKIPNLRRLLAKSQVADGVTGVWPTITWPSHTTMLTGMRPDQHGILGNASGPPDPALSYWSAAKIKVPTLWQCARDAGLTTAAVNWPVTVDAAITWNLPEVYAKRDGDSSDMETVERYSTPGLMDQIAAAYPSFPQQWLDDRARTLAAIFLLTRKHPDLALVHLAELDSESHSQGPFGVNAKAVVERSDELIGDILKALPKDYDLALVSDHGFEQIDHAANLTALANAAGVRGEMKVDGGLVTTMDPNVAAWLRSQSGKGDVGREISHDELMRYAPNLGDAAAAFEPADHVVFSRSDAPPVKGTHGFWPTRRDYHSIFLLSGPGIRPARLGTLEMVSLEQRLQQPLGLSCAK